MQLPRPRALHRAAAVLAVLAVVLPLAGASCSGLFDLQGYSEAAPTLCDLLERCYGRTGIPGCLGHVESRLEGAGDHAVEKWLSRFSADKCLESCTAARLCLDIPPVCKPPGQTCSLAEQCCGFTTGLGTCDLQRCCIPNGVACGSDKDCCATQCINGVCGGVACKLKDEPCVNRFECCSDICDPTSNTCAENTCVDDGFECQNSSECCSSFCNSSNTCGIPPCTKEGDPCSDSAQCCQGFGLECNLDGLCAPLGGCAPDTAPCMSDAECCGMYCAPGFNQCGDVMACLMVGDSCTVPDDCCSGSCGNTLTCECLPDGIPCTDDGQCCTGYCNGATCGNACQDVGAMCASETECCSGLCTDSTCCAPGTCDDVCVEGGPLDPAQCAGTPMDSTCITAVCAKEPGCCCQKWDSVCVTLVLSECGPLCMGPPPMP